MLAIAAATGKERDEEVKVGRELAGPRSRWWQGRSTSAQGWRDYERAIGRAKAFVRRVRAGGRRGDRREAGREGGGSVVIRLRS